MATPSEKLPIKNRLVIYASLLIILTILVVADIAAGFFRGFIGGFLMAVAVGELALYLRRHAA